MIIFDYLDQLYEDIKESDWETVETKYRDLALKWSKKNVVKKISDTNLTSYKKTITEKLAEAVDLAESISAKAIYFEYDMDNNWRGYFLITPGYFNENEGDEDWACEWEEELDGPELPQFAKIYKKYGGYGKDDAGNGTTLYLIARTVCAFGQCVENIPPTSLAICIGFHDQDPIWRILDAEIEE